MGGEEAGDHAGVLPGPDAKPAERQELPGARRKEDSDEGGPFLWLSAMFLIGVMVVAGVGTYGVVGGLEHTVRGGSSTTTTARSPPVAQCVAENGTLVRLPTYYSGVTVFTPYTTVQASFPVSFTAEVPYSTPASTTFYFGDGTNTTTSSAGATIFHEYSNPGLYYIYAVVRYQDGRWGSSLNSLVTLTVVPSPLLIQGGADPTLYASGVGGASRLLSPHGVVDLEGLIQSPPNQPGWSLDRLSFASLDPRVTLTNTSFPNLVTPAYTQAHLVAGACPGLYPVLFEASTTDSAETSWSNFSLTLAVTGVLYPMPSSPSPPRPGTFGDYVLTPSGGFSEDPAVDYETVGLEPILNIYQALISYNGSLEGPYPSDYVPNLATCVPGSAQCAHAYGNTLVSGDNFTFVLNPAAKFYNPATGTSSTVYPVDVLFSIARDCLFATFPFGNPGWILCQALLPGGNSAYDGGLHSPYNNTPTNILNAVTMNSSAYCPSGATDGCVTFNTQYSGHLWPDFLEFVADPQGASILSCRYAASIGGNLAGLPCSATTNPSGIADTAWDNYQIGMGSTGTDYQGSTGSPVASWASTLRWSMVGSGPYYMSNITPGASYTIKVNPNWAGTTCNWTGCIPATFAMKQVNEIYENTAVQGETALENGQADMATVPATDYSSVLIPLLRDGKVTLTSSPGLSISFTNFALYFNQSSAQAYLPAGVTLHAPGDLFQDLAFRQFLIHAYPYTSVQDQYNSVDGIPQSILYDGAIPKGLSNYYPLNISWANSNPDVPSSTSTQSPTYWWGQVQSEKGGIAAGACTGANPCVFPFLSMGGTPFEDGINTAWVSDIANYSKGAVQAVPVDQPPFGPYSCPMGSPTGTGCAPPMADGAWAPDYPDPTDYVGPLYLPDSIYTSGDEVCESLVGSGCAGPSEATANYSNPCPANYVWANASVTTACQGTAYTHMVHLLEAAAFDTDLSARVVLYNGAEHIAQQLGLFAPNSGQSVSNAVVSSWINGASINANPLIAGAGVNTWYTLSYVN